MSRKKEKRQQHAKLKTVKLNAALRKGKKQQPERHVEMVGVKDRKEDGAEALHTCELWEQHEQMGRAHKTPKTKSNNQHANANMPPNKHAKLKTKELNIALKVERTKQKQLQVEMVGRNAKGNKLKNN